MFTGYYRCLLLLTLLGQGVQVIGYPVWRKSVESSEQTSAQPTHSCCCPEVDRCAKKCCCEPDAEEENHNIPANAEEPEIRWVGGVLMQKCHGPQGQSLPGGVAFALPVPNVIPFQIDFVCGDHLLPTSIMAESRTTPPLLPPPRV